MKKLLNILLLLCIVTTINTGDISFAGIDSTTIPVSLINDSQTNNPVNPLDVVKNPTSYLNKKVTMTSKFSKYSTLGLDYKPAFKSSDNYITFLFLRDDATNKIPLSELKMFVSRKTAEKLPDIKEGDIVQVEGTVFSDALGDAWVNIERIKELK